MSRYGSLSSADVFFIHWNISQPFIFRQLTYLGSQAVDTPLTSSLSLLIDFVLRP